MLRGVLIAISTLAAAVVVAPATAHAAAPTAPFSALTFDGREGSWLLSGTLAFDSSSESVSGYSVLGNDYIAVSASSSGHSWSAIMMPPTGAVWTAGTTYAVARSGATVTNGWISVSGDYRGCNQQEGTLTVHEVVRDGASQVTAIAATYTIGCESPTPVLTGEIRWNSMIGYVAGVADVSSLDFGSLPTGVDGTPKTATITSRGSLPITFGTAALGGDDPSAFAITGNTCSGATLAYGQQCQVTITPRPTGGTQTASLAISDNTAAGKKYVKLSVSGVDIQSAFGKYQKVTPARILDTRSGLGAPKAPIRAGGVAHLQVTGRGGVPEKGVSAVVLNVTVQSPTAAGYLTVYPTGVARPKASSINFAKGWTGANSVTVQVGAGGKVDIYNAIGSTQVIADVMGYYIGESDTDAGGEFFPFVPERIFDSRDYRVKLPAYESFSMALDFESIGPNVRAWAVNITAVSPDSSGYLTAWNGVEGQRPGTSTLNFTAGRTVPNMAIVPTAPCDFDPGCSGMPMIGVYNGSGGGVHVLIDIVGYYDDGTLGGGLRFVPRTPVRIADTRTGFGATTLGAGSTRAITAPKAIVNDSTVALAMNVTAVNPSKPTYLTVWPAGVGGVVRPDTSILNPAKNQTVANAAVVILGPTNAFNVFNATGTTNVLVDVVGTFVVPDGTLARSFGGTGFAAHGNRFDFGKSYISGF